MNKNNLLLVGFLQAVGVVVYCVLAGIFICYGNKALPTPPQFVGIILVLSVLVFSVAAVGSLIFGYAAYLALNQNIKGALKLFGFTLMYLFCFILLIIVVVSIL